MPEVYQQQVLVWFNRSEDIFQSPSWEMLRIPEDRIILYHGSKSGIEGKISPISRAKCDFGAGFYMGTDSMQPLTLICDYEKSKFYVVSALQLGRQALRQ